MPVLTDEDIEQSILKKSFNSGIALKPLTDEDIASQSVKQPKVLTDEDIIQAQGNLFTELLKGVGAGVEQGLGQSIGSPMIALGESLQAEAMKNIMAGGKDYGPPLASEFMTKTGRKLEEIGTKIRDFFVQSSLKGIEAPSKDVMTASFGKTGYGRRLSYSLGSSIPMMAAAVGVTAATKNPFLGASIFGPQAFGSFYDEARKNGVDVDNAIALSLVNSASQVGLEVIPLTGWLRKGGGLFKRVARGALQEGLIEEGSQQIVQNSLEAIGWKGKEVDLLNGVTESVIVGTIMGAGMGFVPSSQTVEDWKHETKKQMAKDILTDAKQQGLSPEDVKPVIETIGLQIDKIEPEKMVNISDQVKEEVTGKAVDTLQQEYEKQFPEKKAKPKKREYIPVSLSEEDNVILTNIEQEIAGMQPGRRYVTRNEQGDVVKVGYEPSDYEYIEYWPKGWGKDKFQAIFKNAKEGKLTQKQKGDLELILELYKEVKSERARLEKEGISQSEINAAEGISQEEASGIAETISSEQLRAMPTEELEKYIDSRYEAQAPQEEMDLLETIFDERVSEEDLSMTEEELAMGEGVGLEEQLIKMYDRYLNRDPKTGLSIEGMMSKEDIIANMRAAMEQYGFEGGKLKEGITDEQILDAAKDVYENKKELIEKQKIKQVSYSEIEDLVGYTDGEGRTFLGLSKETTRTSAPWRFEYRYDKDNKIYAGHETSKVKAIEAIKKKFINPPRTSTGKIRLELLPPEIKDLFQRGKGEGELLAKATEALGAAEPVISESQRQEQFKIYEKVDALIHKYAKRFGERYVPSGAVGVLYPKTGNIFLRGANALFTAIHEVTHYIDLKEGISKAALRTTGISKAGNPIYDPATATLRKEMTTFYTSNYPGGRKTHKLEKRMQEGLARFVELYVYKPTYIKENYLYLYKAILQSGGEFFNTTTLDLVRDSRQIIGEYQALSPTNKILARQISKERKIKDSYLSLPEKVYTEIADMLFPIEKLGGEAHLWARFANNGISTITANNVYGDNGYWVMGQEGNFAQKHKFNWKTIIDSVSGETDVFGAWLSARDTKFNFDRLDELLLQIEEAKQFAGRSTKDAKAYQDLVNEAKALKRQLDTNAVTRQEAVDAYMEHAVRFRETAQMYDALNQEDLALLNHPMVQLLSPELYTEFSQRKGYAPKKRDFFFNEILGEEGEYIGNVKVGKTKISSMLPRKGSELPELNPLYSSILSHVEVMKKAVRQMVYNHIFNIASSWPEVLQVVPLKTAVMPTGEIFFPQDKDPNIIMARNGYKRRPILAAKEIKRVLDATVTYQNVHIIEQWMKNISRLFVKGTTATYLPFAATNFLVDQITAAAQTQTKIKPIISPIKELILRLDKHSPDAGFFKEYLILGGQRQTLVRYLDGSPDEVLRNIQQEKNGLEKTLDLINQGVDIFALPTQYSEILTRAAEFIRARKAGDSQIVALEKAGQVTAPFHHKGRWGGTLGTSWLASIPFFNPSIQVIAQYGKAWQNPTTRQRVAFVTSLVVGALIASFEYLRYKGSEEQKELYKSLNPDELARHLFIPHPNGKSLLRMRIPEQMAILGTMINMTLGNLQMDAKYKPGEFVNGALSWLPEQFDPTNPARMLFSWMPHILLPAVGVATGKKFYPEVRDIEGPSLKYLPEGERAYPYTSVLAKELGKRLDISPAKIDYLIEGYLGRATRMFIGKNIGNPFVRNMYIYSSRQLQDYYTTREKNNIEYQNIDKVQDIKDRQRIRNIHDKVQDIDELVSKFRKIDLEKDQSDESYLATLRGQILDRVDTLWEVAR